MAQKGVNKNVWPQFLDTTVAQNIENYIPTSEGLLKTRKGLSRQLNVGGTVAGSMLAKYHDDVKLFAYGTSLVAWDESAGTTTNIKTDFTSDDFEGDKYGDYFFVTSKLNGLWRVSRTVTYSKAFNLAGNNTFLLTGGNGSLSVGDTITGGTSGETAVVVSTSGTLPGGLTVVVDTLSGAFTLNEIITGGSLGANVALSNYNSFTLGSKITGATSGATAIVLEDTGGVTGTLTLGDINGTFQNAEAISDNSGSYGRGTTTATVSYAITSVSAPKASVMQIVGNRMYLGDLSDDESAVAYCGFDDGDNPPFGNSSWTAGDGIENGGRLQYRNGGRVRAIRGMGGLIVVLQDDGKFAFSVDAYESSGTFYKTENTQLNRRDFGGSRASVVTDEGMFYANEAGIWQLASVGQTNVPFSNQEYNLTGELLGKTYFNNITLDDADMTYDPQNRIIMLTCAKNSNTNNFVIVYNIDSKAFSFFTGWGIKRFYSDVNTIYGLDASTMRVYKCLDGYNDDGEDISRVYQQEINFGTLFNKNTVKGCYVQGLLSTTSSIDVRFDMYDETGSLVSNSAQFTWTCQLPDVSGGYGEVGYGESAFGGDSDLNELINSFDGCRPFVRSAQRVVLRITSQGQDMHAISWVSLLAELGPPIRRRKMARISS